MKKPTRSRAKRAKRATKSPVAGRPKRTAAASVRFVDGEGYYVVVDGKPVARYEERADAEACARHWETSAPV